MNSDKNIDYKYLYIEKDFRDRKRTNSMTAMLAPMLVLALIQTSFFREADIGLWILIALIVGVVLAIVAYKKTKRMKE